MESLRLRRAIGTGCASMLVIGLGGCGIAGPEPDDGVPEPETGYQRLQLAVAEDVATLVDPSGLVANPFDAGSLPPDVYGTALLMRAQGHLGLDSLTVDAGGMTVEALDDYRARSAIPEAWLAFALQTVGVEPEQYGIDADASDDDAAADVDERATDVWLGALAASESSLPAYRRGTTSAIAALIAEPELGPVALARLLETCDLLGLACNRNEPVQGTTGIDDVDLMLSTSASLWLVGRGVEVTGLDEVDRGALATAAEETIDSAPGGYELEVSTLAMIAYDADGRTGAFEGYLRRSDTRRDAATGLYRMYAEPRGTIANTFDAVLAVGPYWGEFLERDAVIRAVVADLEGRTLDDPSADVRALYLKSLFTALDGSDLGRLQAAVDACTDQERDIGMRIVLAQLLPLLDRTTCRPSVEVPSWERADEAARVQALGAAQSGVLANSTEVLRNSRPYMRALPRSVLHGDIDDPLFLHRLALLANDRDLLTGKEWDEVGVLLEHRAGCPATPHLLRVSSDSGALCDIGLTRSAMSIGVDYDEGHDD